MIVVAYLTILWIVISTIFVLNSFIEYRNKFSSENTKNLTNEKANISAYHISTAFCSFVGFPNIGTYG
jgi:ABC-type uncharacterized transport system permease subunit